MTERGAPKRYGGKTAQERQDERRDRLIDAGIELFGTVGYHHTSIRAVIRESGVGERYFYENFESLDELLLAAALKAHARVKQVAVEAMTAVEDPTFSKILRAGITAIGESLQNDPRLLRIAVIETLGVSREVDAERSRILDDFVDLVAYAATDYGDIPAPTARYLAIGLMGASNELLTRWATGKLDIDLATVVAYLELMIAGTYAQAASTPVEPARHSPTRV